MGQDNCKPQPGDLIEIDRTRHKHWALYVGDGYVINLTPVAIIRRAKDYIDKDFTYRVFGSNCEHFVKKLRYGEGVSRPVCVFQRRDFVCGEMHLQDTTDDKDYPNPGDLIEICRPGYQHWALYLGKGYVIHVTIDGGASSMFASSGSVLSRKAKVKKELLKDVAQNDKWHVNNKYDLQRTPFPMEEIIRRAEPWIDEELPYRLFHENCEHFVTMLRYGEGVSEQAKAALENINSILSAVMAGIGVTGLVLAAGIPVVGPPLVAAAVAAGGGLLASIGFTSRNIAHSVSFAKFEMAGRDILEQSCC